MTNPHLAAGSVWRLHHDGQEIARLTVTDTDMFWIRAPAASWSRPSRSASR